MWQLRGQRKWGRGDEEGRCQMPRRKQARKGDTTQHAQEVWQREEAARQRLCVCVGGACTLTIHPDSAPQPRPCTPAQALLHQPRPCCPGGLTASSCRICSVVASRARVPLVASSSTAFTVLSSDVTLVTITCGHQRREGSIVLRGRHSTLVYSPPGQLLSFPPTLAEFLSCHTAGSSPTLPAAAFVALMRSPRALATSFTALISTTCVREQRLRSVGGKGGTGSGSGQSEACGADTWALARNP